ncbi:MULTISPECIES: TadE/TadG family type IV pilus assembly protein [unclassified Ruegeria]|uniref:TadE/TadG family type IV pilus assembly protein n=1 Tax=unclassified Ruegeria TaxID=2625375 RepID=UPI0020C1E361|nr:MULTISPECIES: hypothetical protein [unclassified Ruegeria]
MVFWLPFYMAVTYSGVDMGLMAFNHANLERALDEVIRDVRLNNIDKYDTSPGATWEHDMLKDIICDKARYIKNCETNLKLEMRSIDPFVGQNLDPTPFCVNTAEDIRKPEDQVFVPGASNELMIIRACVEANPVWLNSMLGQLTATRASGTYELHATTVFVHEPA